MAGAHFLSKWGDWVRFILTLAAIAAFAVCDTRYVSRADYAQDRAAAERASDALRSSLDTIRTSIALQEQQLKMLSDHEARLRTIEFGRRISSIE